MRKEVDTDLKIKVSNFLSFTHLCMKYWFKKGQNPSAATKPGRAVEIFFFFLDFSLFILGSLGWDCRINRSDLAFHILKFLSGEKVCRKECE